MIIPFDCHSVKVTSPFGERTLGGKREMHGGYDLVGIGSRTVLAAAGGTVVRSRIVTDRENPTWQWGNYVCIRTEAGQYHYYCHLASRAVREGQTVAAGDYLGVMGNTGYSFGAHLHFEVRAADGKTKLSPEALLGIPSKAGTYEMSALDRALTVLYRRGVLNTPEYWAKTAKSVRFLPELLMNVAEELECGS